MIMERLDDIERNQIRLDFDIELAHRQQMERPRALIEKYEQREATSPTVNLNMDAINNAFTADAASAQSSSRDTTAAAQTAKDAAEAAAAARAAAIVDTSPNVLEVADPDAVQKTVLVSPDDVKKAMNMHPGVAMSRAFGRPDKRYGMEVSCAINPKSGARVSEPWLKLHAQTVLPAAFVPKQLFFKQDLKGDEERATLSNAKKLKRMSACAGFKNASKVVKQPEWMTAQAKEALAEAAQAKGKMNASPNNISGSGRMSGTQSAVLTGNKTASTGVA